MARGPANAWTFRHYQSYLVTLCVSGCIGRNLATRARRAVEPQYGEAARITEFRNTESTPVCQRDQLLGERRQRR